MAIQIINPATEEVLQTYEYLDDTAYRSKINNSQKAYLEWKLMPFSGRSTLMRQIAHLLKTQRDDLARLMSQEMGKPIRLGVSEVDKCAWVCEHFAEHAQAYLAPRVIKTDMRMSKVCYLPLGVIFGIMPWNFPFWQVFRFAIPTLMAGNSVLFKHAPITTGFGVRIEDLFLEAGFPPHLVQHVAVDNEGAANIIDAPEVSALTFTGSLNAGRIIAEHAGRCLKKSVMELGGCDPYIVLDDADLDLAAECIVNSRLSNSGQVCIAAKRVIALKSIEEELVEKIKNRMSLFKMGDPLDFETQLGPLARKDLRDTVHEQVEKTIKQGAKLLCGGIIPKGCGFYYPPTLLTGIKPGMVAFDEELFGPVVGICSVLNEQEAIDAANHSVYGLGAAVFTKDLKKGEDIATHKIEAGVCFVNSYVASDPRLPFGGIKQSGYGRELSQEGILEFVNTKTIAISDY